MSPYEGVFDLLYILAGDDFVLGNFQNFEIF